MSVDNFKPEIWSTLLTEILQEKQDITALFNRDYEGEIRNQGDTVHIQKYGGLTVQDYSTTGADITVEEITSTQTDLVINKKKYFAVNVEDIDAIQANIDLNSPVLMDAAEKMQLQMNQDVLSDCLTGVPTAQVISAGASIDLDDFKEARRLLSNNDVPLTDRWAIISPDMESDLLGNANIIQADQYGSSTALVDGEIGRLLGFRIVVSTSLANDGATPASDQAVFMHRSACAFAMQKSLSVEAIRRERRFGDLLRGFALYGTKLVQPSALVVLKRNV